MIMAVATTSIRVNARLADEAKKLLGVKSRSEAARVALREILGLRRSSKVIKKNGGKLSFASLDQ
jgi:Arc/MetJ family transcription regulator